MSGAVIAGDLIAKPEVGQVILADRMIDRDRLEATLRQNPKLKAEEIDVTDYEALVGLIKGKALVINCVGPFYKYGVSPMKAAIEAGTNYVDICDDADVIQEAFALDKAAKEAGVSICLGCGNSPGFSNALIKHTADKLDEVAEIRILVGIGLGGGFGRAVLYHIFHCLMESNLQFIDGRLQTPNDWGMEEIDFGEPIGRQQAFYFGHPEPVTLPRYIKGIKKVVFKLCSLPPQLNDWFLRCIELGFADSKPVKIGNRSIVPRDFIVEGLSNSALFEKERERFTTANRFFIIKGKEGGKDVTYNHHITGLPSGMTGHNCAFAAEMLYRGEVKEKGVLSPEAFLDAERLLAYWRERGLNLRDTRVESYARTGK
jgi:saccharopine dehydrogenase-like NADP-dependent oxidoreductase